MTARPKAHDARDTRRLLVEAALELFAEQGYFATSLRDIGRAVGIRESAIYHHFAGKEALFEAVLFEPDEGERFGPPAAPPMPPQPLDQAALQALFERWVAVAMDKFSTLRERKRFRIMLSEGMRLAHSGKLNYFDKMAPLRQPIIDFVGQLMEADVLARRDPQLTGMMLMAPLLLWRQLLEVMPEHEYVQHPQRYGRQVVEQFLQGALGAASPDRDLSPDRNPIPDRNPNPDLNPDRNQLPNPSPQLPRPAPRRDWID